MKNEEITLEYFIEKLRRNYEAAENIDGPAPRDTDSIFAHVGKNTHMKQCKNALKKEMNAYLQKYNNESSQKIKHFE